MTAKNDARSVRALKVSAEIADLEARLAALNHERDQVQLRIDHLRAEFSALESQSTTEDEGLTPAGLVLSLTPAEKVALFRSLFRGRDDVYPKRWENPRTRKTGYAPACANEWVRGVCEKPRVKCGECSNQAFSLVTDQVILDHLQGRNVIGAYPLLENETCWFLAVDFDKRSWTEDVSAFAETCRRANVPVAVERSRSGNGAHTWFFFSAPVSAATARRMGSYLVTETMARHHKLSMESYDRLFPNQDTMPRGGFGNLIALPLQQDARQHGNTVFLNEQLIPYPNQWAYLARIERIAPSTVERIAADAVRRGLVIGVRRAAGSRKNGRWHVPGCRAGTQHVDSRASSAAARPMGSTAVDVPRNRQQGHRPNRSRQAQAERFP
jgi:hypothetical protein